MDTLELADLVAILVSQVGQESVGSLDTQESLDILVSPALAAILVFLDTRELVAGQELVDTQESLDSLATQVFLDSLATQVFLDSLATQEFPVGLA